ncbi:MAG: hypothetical protein AAGD11_07975 [Planctomycetota bacterium]
MITQQLAAYLEQCFTMPVLPATVLMLLIMAYSCLVLLGALDFELFDIDFDVDADADLDAISSAGFVTLKFLNLADVPIMVWISIYGIVWWALSVFLWFGWDQSSADPSAGLLVIRNVAAAVIVTKFLTEPLAKVFAKPPNLRPQDLIGQECEVTTHTATEEFGQARFQTEAAPLILDVRTTDRELSKGENALIVDYDPDAKIHYIEATTAPP